MDIQGLMDALSDSMRGTRSDYHLTLGKAIEALEAFEPGLPVRFDFSDGSPHSAHSYRGYYSDLAFDVRPPNGTVGDFLADCRLALNETFEGYKGGDFVMDERTPLWAASYGTTAGARAITGLAVSDGIVIVQTKEIE